jgi:hypothetical protein
MDYLTIFEDLLYLLKMFLNVKVCNTTLSKLLLILLRFFDQVLYYSYMIVLYYYTPPTLYSYIYSIILLRKEYTVLYYTWMREKCVWRFEETPKQVAGLSKTKMDIFIHDSSVTFFLCFFFICFFSLLTLSLQFFMVGLVMVGGPVS